ncbi:GFA family protein [Rhodalgimonas zhirmunskyi]|uniref:GFA family protein n=1 Tax=Rhodalgimonas zhirmunskyi TaxID=2964767 RepID=A0AAJ1UAE0_9RHOB|nr:GFA family protein [Rhodoalgimonas zhirmunskyi]MDQ2094213.1 GFA family protein [Rhodoalgimonas zhirmunskyi]
MHTGHCLCGATRFTIALDTLRQPSACHCSQCRRSSGHLWGGTTVMNDELTLDAGDNLKWFRSSEWAERGFCSACGSSLFYRPVNSDHLSVAIGCIDPPTDTRFKRHIFVADKGDYYEIGEDGIPRFETY